MKKIFPFLLCCFIVAQNLAFAQENASFADVMKDIKSKSKETHQDLLDKKKSIEREKEEVEIFEFLKKQYESKIANTQNQIAQKKSNSSLAFDTLSKKSETLVALYQEIALEDQGALLASYTKKRLAETKSKIDGADNIKAKHSSYVSYGMKPEREEIIKDLVSKYDDCAAGLEVLNEVDLLLSDYSVEFNQLQNFLEEDKKRIDKLRQEIAQMDNQTSTQTGTNENNSKTNTNKKEPKKKK